MQRTACGQRLIPLLAVFLIGAADREVSVVDAAKKGDREGIRALLKRQANVNLGTEDGTTALHWASFHDDLETADILIRAGAKANAASDLGVTALWLSSVNGSAAMTQRLLQAGANPNAALLLGETPLMAASRTGKPAVVELLIAKGAKVNARAARDQTALMWAAAQKHPEVVRVLLLHGADIHARSAVRSEMMAVPPHGVRENNRDIAQGGYTPLLFASREGDLASARLLVGAGANVDDADAWGVSATLVAAQAGNREIVEFLLEKGANPNATAAGFHPLHVAIMRRDQRMASALLSHGADPNVPLQNWTPTRRASDDFNFPPAFVGATPFWLAARVAEPEIMRQLVEYGADAKVVLRVDYTAGGGETGYIPRKEATTALMAATGMGGGRAWLLGPEPSAADAEALILEAAKVAVELGVDINAANVDGRTALDAAEARKYRTVVEFLRANGAQLGTRQQKSQNSAQENR